MAAPTPQLKGRFNIFIAIFVFGLKVKYRETTRHVSSEEPSFIMMILKVSGSSIKALSRESRR
jgi:hypothetical protein